MSAVILRSRLPCDIISHIKQMQKTNYARSMCKSIYPKWNYDALAHETYICSKGIPKGNSRAKVIVTWSRVDTYLLHSKKITLESVEDKSVCYTLNTIVLSPEQEPFERPSNGNDNPYNHNYFEYVAFQDELIRNEMNMRMLVKDTIQLRELYPCSNME